MTDRVQVLTVILDKPYRDEEESLGVITNALLMTKCVKEVSAHKSNEDILQSINEWRYQADIGDMIAELARYPDAEFLKQTKAAFAAYKARRGY